MKIFSFLPSALRGRLSAIVFLPFKKQCQTADGLFVVNENTHVLKGNSVKAKLAVAFLLFLGLGALSLFALYPAPQNIGANSLEASFRVKIPPTESAHHTFRAAITGNGDFLPVLRVAAPPKARLASLLSPFGEGLDRDLLERFAADYGFTLQYREVDSYAEASAMLKQNEVDLAAGFPGSINFTLSPDLLSSPAYQQDSPVLLRLKGKNAKTKNQLLVSEPGLKEAVDNTSALPDSPALSKDITTLVDRLDDGASGYALLDNTSFKMLSPLFLRENTSSRKLKGTAFHHWVWRNDDSLLALSLQAFWRDEGTNRYLADLTENYNGFLPKNLNSAKTKALIRGLENELTLYHKDIADAAREYNLDPLLLTAVMFQESRFKNDTSGNTGKGLMQLTSNTAASLGVDPADPRSNIKGGAKYLRQIFNSLPKEDIGYWDKWFLTLAAYNQGPRHLSDAMRLAAEMNEGSRSWRAVKDAYVLNGKNGSVRGEHVVKYVQEIRYYYYVLNGLVVLNRPEAQHLTPLLARSGSSVRRGS